MSGRHRWLLAYDIRDARRLRRVYNVVRCRGDHLQYSVFLCDLSKQEKLELMGELREIIKHSEDSVAFIDLGVVSQNSATTIEFMGTALPLPTSGPTII